MMNKKILSLILIFSLALVSAHQPRIVFETQSTLNNPVIIEQQEISKAYYGNLNGDADYFSIESDKEFLLYLNILSPKLNDSRTDFVVEVLKDGEFVLELEGGEWEEFYEEFGRDYYLRGPEAELQVEPGKYLIKVSNPNNQGKYSLAVGKIEEFPFIEIVKTIIVLPKIKRDFFNKSIWNDFWELGVGVGILIIIIFFILKWKMKRRFR